MLSPDDIAQRRFLVALRGYDRDEVTAFLEEVAGEVRSLRARVAELQADLARLSDGDVPEGATRDPRAAFAALGQETTRILVAAEESAREIEAQAASAAEATRDEAQRDAREATERANRQAARTIAEAERRRDAVAAEIADLRGQRDQFVQGLRAAVDGITGTVEALGAGSDAPTGGSAAAADPDAAEDPAPAPAPDVVVAPESRAPEPPPAPEPVVLEPAPEPEPAAEPAPVAEPVAADTVGGRRDARLGTIRDDMARQCKRGLQEIQNEVLASIREHGRRAQLEDLLPSERELDDLGSQGAQHLVAAYDGAIDDAAAAVGGDAPTDLVGGTAVQAAATRFAAVLAHEVTSALRATLRAGLEAGEPEPQLSERVGEAFRDLRGPVIEATVDEHVQRTYGQALVDAWTALGVDRLVWEAHEEPRCPEGRCRTNAAEGAVPIGADFPSGDRVPPAHAGCTCVVVPAS